MCTKADNKVHVGGDDDHPFCRACYWFLREQNRQMTRHVATTISSSASQPGRVVSLTICDCFCSLAHERTNERTNELSCLTQFVKKRAMMQSSRGEGKACWLVMSRLSHTPWHVYVQVQSTIQPSCRIFGKRRSCFGPLGAAGVCCPSIRSSFVVFRFVFIEIRPSSLKYPGCLVKPTNVHFDVKWDYSWYVRIKLEEKPSSAATTARRQPEAHEPEMKNEIS